MTTMINRGPRSTETMRAASYANYVQTVPRHLVHRTAVSEVFITDVHVADQETSYVGAQWPRAHGFFGPKYGLHDPLLMAETLRQATLAVAHQAYGVPQGWQFVLQDLTYEIDEHGLRQGSGPANIALTARASEVRWRKTTVAGMTLDYECHRDQRLVGGGVIRWRCVSPASYERVRGKQFNAQPVAATRPVPVAPHLVGRHTELDVVLGGSPLDDTWLLRVDTDHPVMFDHAVDHVPGMLVAEAARQAAQLLTGRPDVVVTCGAFSYDRYIELDEPCIVRAARHGDIGIKVLFEQSGQVVATAAVRPLGRR